MSPFSHSFCGIFFEKQDDFVEKYYETAILEKVSPFFCWKSGDIFSELGKSIFLIAEMNSFQRKIDKIP